MDFCETHLPLLFTRVKDERDVHARAAITVALGDLAFRFPNALEPWTEHLYGTKEWGNALRFVALVEVVRNAIGEEHIRV